MPDVSPPSTNTPQPRRPRLAVFKFASCDGCQLQLLSCEDELLALGEAVDIVHFLEASSHVEEGPFDIALVEGSVTTYRDVARIQQIREQTQTLVTIGACATTGGVQALKNWGRREEFLQAVYAHPEFIDTLATSTPIADHVHVDFELRGCPINKTQLLALLRDLIARRRPSIPQHAVCLECKRLHLVCVAVATDSPCLGPITQAGCGALCPGFDRGCYGCFGPAAQPNCDALVVWQEQQGNSPQSLLPILRNFNANAPAFRDVSNHLADRITDPNAEFPNADSSGSPS